MMVPKELVSVGFSIVERFAKNTTDIFFSSGLNKHLGTTGLNISEIAQETARRGLNISDAMAIVEQDGWNYTGQYHDGESMVCSMFVVGLWKAAGLFKGEVNANEWGPKDVY